MLRNLKTQVLNEIYVHFLPMCGCCSQALMFLLVWKAHLKYLWELLGSTVVTRKNVLNSLEVEIQLPCREIKCELVVHIFLLRTLSAKRPPRIKQFMSHIWYNELRHIQMCVCIFELKNVENSSTCLPSSCDLLVTLIIDKGYFWQKSLTKNTSQWELTIFWS